MNVTYGIKIAPKNDRYITIAEKALNGMSEAATPGRFLVDLLPFCRCFPLFDSLLDYSKSAHFV